MTITLFGVLGILILYVAGIVGLLLILKYIVKRVIRDTRDKKGGDDDVKSHNT